MNLEPIITALLASLGYAVLFYIKSELPDLSSLPLEQMITELIKRFNFGKFVSTLLVGMGVGLVTAIQDGVVTQQSFETQFALYAVYVITVENVLKTAWRFYKNRGT